MKSLVVGENFSLDKKVFKNHFNECLEILIFGCGYGESILIKSDTGKYIVVDSFINSATNNPIVIDYLNSISESLDKIKCVVVTHFHDDHIRGITKIVEESHGAKLVLNPVVFYSKKIMDYIAKTKTIDTKSNYTTSEIVKLINFIEKGNVDITYSLSNRVVFCDEDSDNFSMESLSPHDKSLDNYLMQIDNRDIEVARELSKIENLMSVVLLVKTTNNVILLGGDCVSNNNSAEGWESICKNYLKRSKNNRIKANTFKIPHHGSATGQCETVWKEMLHKNPLSVLTVFNKGKKVPNDSEIEWILNKTNELYVVGNIKKNNDLLRQLKKAGAFMESDIYYNQGKIGIFKCEYANDCSQNYSFSGYVTKFNKD